MTLSNPTIEMDSYEQTLDALDSNFGAAPKRRAAHAKGVVVYGAFRPGEAAHSISRAGHFREASVPVVARFSNFPGGEAHADAAPESNPRGFAVQFRLPDGTSTDILAHSIDGFPGRTVEDFVGFLRAISPQGPGPEDYLGEHPEAAEFVKAIQTHRTPKSYGLLTYYAVNAFRFQDAYGVESVGRYSWEPATGNQFISDSETESLGFDYLADELEQRLSSLEIELSLILTLAEVGDVTDDANAHWPLGRRQVTLGTVKLTSAAEDSSVAGQGLFFDPVRLVDGIALSDDPLLVGRTRMYPLSLARRHEQL
jgi:catalase